MIGLLIAAGLLLIPSGKQQNLEGQPIVRIKVIRHDVFWNETAWPYKAANAIHALTKERFIRKVLLFKEGDPWDPELAEESARLLRSLGWLNPVNIWAEPAAEGGVEVTVETHDQWTLEVGANVGVFGSTSEHGFAITDKNLMGLGKEVSVDYQQKKERSSWRYTYYDPLFMGSRWRLRVVHEDTSDGLRDQARIELPFYSLASSTGLGFEFSRDRIEAHLYSDGDSVAVGCEHVDHASAWWGWKVGEGSGYVNRFTLGFARRHEKHFGWRWEGGEEEEKVRLPEDHVIDATGPTVGFQHLSKRYKVVQGFRGWSVQEDLPLGTSWNLSVQLLTEPLGSSDTGAHLHAEHQITGIRGRTVFLLRGALTGYVLGGKGVEDAVLGLEGAVAQLGSSGIQARLKVEVGRDLFPHRQLTLGADTGLRGWDPDTFDGVGRVILNVQWRSLLAERVLDLVSVGVEVFADAGTTWGARIGRPTGRVRKDVGIGLVADLPTIGLAQLVRLEVAFPDDGSGPCVLLTSEALF